MAFFLEGPFMERMQRKRKAAVQEQKHYACDVCSVTFSSEQEFSDHAKTHSRRTQPRKQKSTRKVTRSKTFNQTIDNVIDHLQLEREETTQVQKNYSSSRGRKQISFPGNNLEQMKTESEAKSYHEVDLKKHAEAHKEDTQHTCTKCDMQFSDEDTLDCHMMVHDNSTKERPDDNKYHCIECGKAFTLKRTLKGNQDALPQRCTKCYMKAHMLANPKNSFKCLTCRKSFDTKQALTTHMTEHDLKKYRCETCGELFSDREDLAVHMVLHNMKTKHGCSKCKNTSGEVCQDFLEQKNLELCHCELCGRAFRRMSYLQKHMLTHSGPSPYECLECHKSFTQKSRLNTHLLGSCGKKRFQCEKCDESFYQKNNLMMHYATHMSQGEQIDIILPAETVYDCHKCDRAFSDVPALEQHLVIHSQGHVLYQYNADSQNQNENEMSVSNQYPTVAHILDSPPVNQPARQVVEHHSANQTVVQILESPPLNQAVMQTVEASYVDQNTVQVYESAMTVSETAAYPNYIHMAPGSEAYPTVAHILDSPTVNPSDRVPYPAIVTQVQDSPMVGYADRQVYAAGPQPVPSFQNENVEKTKFQMIVQTMCNILTSKPGS